MVSFSLLVGSGVLLGLVWLVWRLPEKSLARGLDIALVLFLGGVLGGRIGYVAVSWTYYRSHLSEIGQVWQGGFSGPAALAGVLLALLLTSLLTRQRLALLADMLYPAGLVIAVSAWLACWQAGCAYGPVISSGVGLPARDEWGVWSIRFPTQLIGALATLLLLWGIERVRLWLSVPGWAAALSLLGISLELFGLSYLRADPSLYWQGMRLDAWAALVFAGIALAALIAFGITRKPR